MGNAPAKRKTQDEESTDATQGKKPDAPEPARTLKLVPSFGNVPRRFRRYPVCCDVILAFPQQNAHPRMRGHMFQIGRGGCALSAEEMPFIGAQCIVWALGSGSRYLGVHGHITWVKPVRKTEVTNSGDDYTAQGDCIMIGIEFEQPIDLPRSLLDRLGNK